MKRIGLLLMVFVAIMAASVLVWPKRVSAIYQRGRGRIQVARGCSVFTPGIFKDEEDFERAAKQVHEIRRDGNIALYETPIGPIWYRTSAWTLPALVEENQSDAYRMRTTIKPGDVVIDVGANVGTDTRTALSAGAGLVMAIEPEPVTLECLRRNLADEIAARRVIVVPKGAWDKDETLLLHVDQGNAGGSSVVWRNNNPTVPVPLTTIDRMVAEAGLTRVDLIKMDIEGAEKNALMGAAQTIRRFHPRLALVLEHSVDDVDLLPAVARKLWPGYRLTLTDCTKTFQLIHPETALLTP